jgi:hypothetical protein
MEFPDIVFIFVATLALIFAAASLPRGLLAVAFFAAVATVAAVVWLGGAPTRSQNGTASAGAFSGNHCCSGDLDQRSRFNSR